MKNKKFLATFVMVCMLVMIFGTVALAGSNSANGTYDGYGYRLSCECTSSEASAQFTYGGGGRVYVYGTVLCSNDGMNSEIPVYASNAYGSADVSYNRAGNCDYITGIKNVCGQIGVTSLGNISAYAN